jgi:multiple antibiotic resistance protein
VWRSNLPSLEQVQRTEVGTNRHYTQVLSFHILAHSFALTKKSTRLFSCDSALFGQKHGGWGYPSHQKAGKSPASAILSSPEDPLEVAKSILLILTALFPIVNPLGGSPVFLALTRDYPCPLRRVLARQVALNSFILLIASFLIGTHILHFFGISIPVVQVGGGLIVISNGWTMLKSKEEVDRGPEVQKKVNPNDVFRSAFYPLTLPLTVGPGSISMAITLGANEPHRIGPNFFAILAAVIGSALVAVTIYLCYGFADRLAAVIGESGMSIILRLSSFLLVCIGVQILWNGASALIESVHM